MPFKDVEVRTQSLGCHETSLIVVLTRFLLYKFIAVFPLYVSYICIVPFAEPLNRYLDPVVSAGEKPHLIYSLYM